MANRPFQPTAGDKRRIRLRTQLISGYFTGRAIALLIVCGLIIWFVFIQWANAEAFRKPNSLLTACLHAPTMGLRVMK